jgi:hypothetical protein
LFGLSSGLSADATFTPVAIDFASLNDAYKFHASGAAATRGPKTLID